MATALKNLVLRLTQKQFWILVGTVLKLAALKLWEFSSSRTLRGWEWSKKQVTSFWSYLSLPENKFLKFSLGYAVLWITLMWVWTSNWISMTWLHWTILPLFIPGIYFAFKWYRRAETNQWSQIARLRMAALLLIPILQVLTYLVDGLFYEMAKVVGATSFTIVSLIWAGLFCWDLTTGSYHLRRNLSIGYGIAWCWFWYLWSASGIGKVLQQKSRRIKSL